MNNIFKNSRSRLSNARRRYKIVDVTAQTAANTGNGTQENVSPLKSVRKIFAKNDSRNSRSRYTDANISRFEYESHSPAKTDKSVVLKDNQSASKSNNMAGVHKILEKLDNIEFKNKHAHLRNRKDTRPLLTTEISENTKFSIHDRNHPMNLSVSSLNSLSKSRDSRMGVSMTANNDIKNDILKDVKYSGFNNNSTCKDNSRHSKSKLIK